MTYAFDLPNSALCEEISQLLHTVLLEIHRRNSKLLTDSCRIWVENASEEEKLAKIKTSLQQQPDIPALLGAIDHILGKFFITDFVDSKAHGQIRQRVQALINHRSGQLSSPGLDNQGSSGIETEQDDRHSATEPEGLLLVDAENMNPPEALENFLQGHGQYPIRHRLAFGNWRKLGNRDQEFYRRGYQMVHVPSGKNSADIKMSLDASLISLWNPSIREVFICSADTDVLHLGHTLRRFGVIPYWVKHNQDTFDIINMDQQTTQVFRLPQVVQEDAGDKAIEHQQQAIANSEVAQVPTLAQMKSWLKILVRQAQQANPGQPITVGQLGKLFRDRNQIAANQALQANSDYKSLKQFLAAHDEFELLPLANNQQLEVRLKSPVTVESPANQGIKSSVAEHAPQKITDARTLEQALVKLLWSLSSKQTGGQVSLSVVGSQFAVVHREPLSKVLKRIGEPKGLPKFLAKCNSLRIQKHGKEWRVALVCVS